MIEFYDGSGVLGQAGMQGGVLVADPPVQSYVDTWLARGQPAEQFEPFYDGWSNGYVSARRVGTAGRSRPGWAKRTGR